MTKKTYDPAKKMIATRIDRGLLMQFDATAKARKMFRTDAVEAAMRVWMNGKTEKYAGLVAMREPFKSGPPLQPLSPRRVGYDAITGEPIFKSGVGPRGGKK